MRQHRIIHTHKHKRKKLKIEYSFEIYNVWFRNTAYSVRDYSSTFISSSTLLTLLPALSTPHPLSHSLSHYLSPLLPSLPLLLTFFLNPHHYPSHHPCLTPFYHPHTSLTLSHPFSTSSPLLLSRHSSVLSTPLSISQPFYVSHTVTPLKPFFQSLFHPLSHPSPSYWVGSVQAFIGSSDKTSITSLCRSESRPPKTVVKNMM